VEPDQHGSRHPGGERQVRGTATEPPSRPAGMAPEQLGFTPQRPVRWFSPGVLVSAGVHVGLTSVFGSFLDKRELQARQPARIDRSHARPRAGASNVWIDYMADTGDGFAATATVARELARPHLDITRADGTVESLPRGEILVLGGDEVYPGPSAENYANHLEGPFAAVLPWTDEPHPHLYAIPGNHDWYDGLTGFLRVFTQNRWIGGWQTRQSRSYFALQLPQRWWLWGVDIQLDMLIDDPQLRFFETVLDRHALPGDKLILCTAVPAWVELERDRLANRNLAYLERALLNPAGVELRLTIAGDLHHYARYSHPPLAEDAEVPDDGTPRSHKLTAGGGGAFTHPTHDLPSEIAVALDPERHREVTLYAIGKRHPDRRLSRRLALRAVLLPFRNPAFVVVPAVLNVLVLWANQFGIRSLGRPEESFAAAVRAAGWRDLAVGIGRNPVSAGAVVALFAALVAFARTPAWAATGWKKHVVRLLMGAVHTAAQVVTVVTVALVSIIAAARFSDGAWFVVWTSLFVLVLGGLASSIVVGAYLAAANVIPGLQAHKNEALAAARVERFKNFLRMKIDQTGALTVYAIGIDPVVSRWKVDTSTTDRRAPWLVPDEPPPKVRLIERFTVS
jgi:hypothetical protein